MVKAPMEGGMSKEYVEREVISEGIRKYYYKNPPNSSYQEGFDCGLDKAQRVILDAPAADVALVRHERWKKHGSKWQCTGCKVLMSIDGTPQENLLYYCPNCGALMDKEE